MSRPTVDDLFHNEVTAWIVLAVSLTITAIGWQVSSDYVERRAQDRFEFELEDTRQRILQRMLEYEQVLRSGIALFQASDTVTRNDWHKFVTVLDIDRYYPGIQGIGFSLVLEAESKEAHEAEIRSQGFPEYEISPTGKRNQYSAIVYLEPFDWRNKRAFGFDMLSEPVRNSAMTLAARTGLPAVSGKVTLVQETDQDIQAGFLMYLPLYAIDEDNLTTTEKRIDSLVGYVYSPFRVDDLMEGILGQSPAGIRFQLYDHEGGDKEPGRDSLLYESFKEQATSVSKYNATSILELPNRKWTMHFHSLPKFETETANPQPMIIAVGGVTVDLLLFLIIFSLSVQKKRIKAKNQQLESIDAERKNALQQLEQLAYFDALTKLPNRRMFINNIKQSIAFSQRDNLYRAIIFIDLDKFKPVNDKHGHELGDTVLIEVANRLTQSVREIDTVCRLAGDEFVVLIERLATEKEQAETQAVDISEKIRRSLKQPYRFDDLSLDCSASLGLLLFRGNQSTYEKLLRLADEGMYQAKRSGGNRLHVIRPTGKDIPCT